MRPSKIAQSAKSAARRMPVTSADAVALMGTGDPATGEFTDAAVLRQFGKVPSLEALLGGG